MRKLFNFLLLFAVVGGAVWFQNRTDDTTIPVQIDSGTLYEEPGFFQETSTEVPSTTQVSRTDVDFSSPEVIMEVSGSGGDDVRISEVIGKPHHLNYLPKAVKAMITSCDGVTDRDMVVQIDSEVELTSSLPAKVSVDYGVIGKPALFEYNTGLQCDDGRASHELHAHGVSHLTFWVVISGAVTPDHPNGDFTRNSWQLQGLNVTLPNLEMYSWKAWGPRVKNCSAILGSSMQIWLAGQTPDNCQPASTEATALGTT